MLPYNFISIHALREEGDLTSFVTAITAKDFNPRPPRGGRLIPEPNSAVYLDISIHALREEGDSYHIAKTEAYKHFNPRPPRGGRLEGVK